MKKRFLSILTTLCLCLTLLPATAMAESGSIDQAKFVVTNWGALQTNLENSTKEVIDATLEKDITWGGSSLTVPEGKMLLSTSMLTPLMRKIKVPLSRYMAH